MNTNQPQIKWTKYREGWALASPEVLTAANTESGTVSHVADLEISNPGFVSVTNRKGHTATVKVGDYETTMPNKLGGTLHIYLAEAVVYPKTKTSKTRTRR